MSEEVTNGFICIMKAKEQFWILMGKDETGNFNIIGWKTQEEGIKYFEKAYNTAHIWGLEASTGATLNWLAYQPSIVQAPIETIVNEIAAHDPHLFTLRSVSGKIDVVDTRYGAESWWNKGAKPSSISYDDATGRIKYVDDKITDR